MQSVLKYMSISGALTRFDSLLISPSTIGERRFFADMNEWNDS